MDNLHSEQTDTKLLTDRRQGCYPFVWVIVLTWNNYADTAECLESLRGLIYPNYRVLVVDNGSIDGTPKRTRATFPEVIVLENGANLGVPAGYNVGFRYALEHDADYVMMLNNDTIVDSELLTHLVAAAQSEPAGILVAVAYYYQNPGSIWSAGARYRRFPPAVVMEKRLFSPNNGYHRLEYAIGCCILISRAAFERAGLLDETYRFMWEDLDLARRVHAAGLPILQVPDAKIWHKVSRSTRPETDLFWEVHGESGAIFHRRHGSYWTMAVHLGYFALREFVLKRQWRFLRPFLRGLRMGLSRPLKPFPRIEGRRSIELAPHQG
jgi:GT2 family glycosyltransferase